MNVPASQVKLECRRGCKLALLLNRDTTFSRGLCKRCAMKQDGSVKQRKAAGRVLCAAHRTVLKRHSKLAELGYGWRGKAIGSCASFAQRRSGQKRFGNTSQSVAIVLFVAVELPPCLLSLFSPRPATMQSNDNSDTNTNGTRA